MLHFPHFWRKLCSKFRSYNQPGPSPAGSQWCTPLPFKICAPISCLAPRLLVHPTWFLKNVAPLVTFWRPCWEILATGLQPTDHLFTLTSLQSGSRSCQSVPQKIIILWYTSTLPTASLVKYKRDSTRKILIFMQNARNCWFRLQACVSAENLETMKKHFGDDLDALGFSIQLAVLSDAVSGVSGKMKDVISSTLAVTSNCNIFSELMKLLLLLCVLPVATASAKRSFSFLLVIWTCYLRMTMSVHRKGWIT